MNYTIASPGFRMEGLEPGQRNDFEIKSYCLMSGDRKGQAIEYKLFSNAAEFRTRSKINKTFNHSVPDAANWRISAFEKKFHETETCLR